MSNILLRSTKGSPLTNAEIDTNFSNLNTDKIQSGDTVDALNITSATISGGSISGITDLAIADGGTGASTAEGARTNLGLAIGTNVQAYSTHLATLVNAQKIAGNFVVGNGTTWTVQSGATARNSLGLGSMSTQNSDSVTISGGNISGITDLAIEDGGTGASDAAGARTNLGLGTLATANTINNSNWSGSVLSIANGGTGANSATGARTNLGLGTVAIESVVPASKGGTGLASPGASGNVLTSDGTTWQSQAFPQGIGEGQTWQTVSRSKNVTYTNTTGRPIMVSVSVAAAAVYWNAYLFVNSVLVGYVGQANANGDVRVISTIVPAGATYVVTGTSFNINGWAELRS